MYKLVLVRHGESLWNKANKFTGWVDVDLTDNGVEEAKKAAQLLKENNFEFDMVYTSVLKRAIRTLWIMLEELNMSWLPVTKSWRLNERHYGALQGLNKKDTAEKYGSEQVHIWRRSFDVPPAALEKSNPMHPTNDPRYKNITEELPATEALKQCQQRVLPLWEQEIAPLIKSGKKILIVAHGNSLRSLIKHLDDISDDKITEINVPTAIPLVYELDEDLKPIKSYYLGDTEEAQRKADAVKNQSK